MTGNRPSINILTPPPTTVIMQDGHIVKTVGDRWKLSEVGNKNRLNFSRFRAICTPAFVNGLQWACHKRLCTVCASKAYQDLNMLINYLEDYFEERGARIHLLTESDILNLKRANADKYNRLRGLLRAWVENGYYGLASETLAILNKKHKQNKTNRLIVVDTLCPQKGPLLELEESLFNQALKDLYAENEITLDEYLLSKLTLVFGARPKQWSDLKIKNLVVEQFFGGRSYGLLIPWAKQKNKKRAPVYFPLARYLGEILFLQAERVRVRFPEDSLIKGMNWDNLPLFPDQKKKVPLPRSASSITNVIKGVGDKAKIPNQREGGDGSPITINAMRLRHTVGTRLATRGEYDARDIADYLLQSNLQSPTSYVELKEFLLENFNEYWNVRLEANAKVALGIISAEEAKRIDGPRITFSEDGRHRPGVGKCGKTGCKARAPLACYPCSKFRPLLDAPHDQYLQSLLVVRDRQLEVAPKHISVYDTSIWYVRRVIEACEQIKSEGGL